MNVHDFNYALENFSADDATNERKHLYKLRENFVKDFSLENLKKLKVDL